MGVTALVCALLLGILYGLLGKVDFTVRHLSSSTTSFPSSWDFSSGQPCIGNSKECSAYSAKSSSETTWTMRTSFPEYVVALATIAGSVLFMIFNGVGIACLPLGLIFAFIRRPKAVITRSQYIKVSYEFIFYFLVSLLLDQLYMDSMILLPCNDYFWEATELGKILTRRCQHIPTFFGISMDSYSEEEIDEVRDEWLGFVESFIA